MGWDERERHYTTISEAVFPADPAKKNFHISTEAFLVLLWENCRDKWQACLQWLANPANRGQKLPKRTKTNKHMDIFQSRYTTQDGGQQRMGGWTPEGITRYNEIFRLIEQAKYDNLGEPNQAIKPAYLALEQDFLRRLHAKLGLHAATM